MKVIKCVLHNIYKLKDFVVCNEYILYNNVNVKIKYTVQYAIIAFFERVYRPKKHLL